MFSDYVLSCPLHLLGPKRTWITNPAMKAEWSAVSMENAFAGVLLGTAVGDALGLPAENLSPERIRKTLAWRWRMRFLFGRGMISDDTEHTLMVAQALLAHPDDAAAFQRALGRKLRWWFAGLPGGVGLATAKACLRLWIGFPAHRCAVVSAGGGPAMRSAILGAFFAAAPERRREFVLASARLTHRGWQAETAALAVAEAVAFAVRERKEPAAGPLLSAWRGLLSGAGVAGPAFRKWRRPWHGMIPYRNLCARLG